MPWLDLLLLKNPILRLLDKLGIMSFTFPVVTFAKKHMNERLAEMQQRKEKGKGDDTSTDRRGDLLSMFLKAKADHPDFMTDARILTLAVSMAFAGSETTAISLAAVFYYLLKNPRCYQKLLEEIIGAVKDGTIENRSRGIVTWAESQKLPYLDACVKEAFRLHPAAGLTLERIVPPQGAEMWRAYPRRDYCRLQRMGHPSTARGFRQRCRCLPARKMAGSGTRPVEGDERYYVSFRHGGADMHREEH